MVTDFAREIFALKRKGVKLGEGFHWLHVTVTIFWPRPIIPRE